MQNKAFQQCLADVYHGEIVGEVAFDNMLSQVSAPQEQYIVGSLLQYEAEAKAMMRPLLMRYGLAMHDANQGYATGQAASGQINQLPWAERFAALRGTGHAGRPGRRPRGQPHRPFHGRARTRAGANGGQRGAGPG